MQINNQLDGGQGFANGAVAAHNADAGAHGLPALSARVSALEEDWTPAPGRGRYFVADYGALGDGEADDTLAVQAAITAAGEGGGYVDFGSLTCRVSALTCNAATNVDFCGSSGKIVGTTAGTILTITGYPSAYRRVHLRGMIFSAEVDGVTAVKNEDNALWMQDVSILNSVSIGCMLLRSINTHIVDCQIMAKAVGVAFVGTVETYAGFSVLSNSRIGGPSCLCAIYSDSSAWVAGGGGGGLKIESCWFESFPGLAYYGHLDSMPGRPVSFKSCWFEGIGSAAAVDLSAVGGPSNVPCNYYTLYLDGSNLTIDTLNTSARLRNYATLSADVVAVETASHSGLVDCDATSTVYAGRSEPTFAEMPSYPVGQLGVNIRKQGSFCETDHKTKIVFDRNNLLGDSGMATGIFRREDVVGTTVTEAVLDETAPLFPYVTDFTQDPASTLYIYGRPDWVINWNAGKVYAVSYAVRVISGSGNVKIDCASRLPEIPARLVADGRWHTFHGVFVPNATGQEYITLSHDSDAAMHFVLSCLQVVEFDSTESALHYLGSGSFAAARAGSPMGEYIKLTRQSAGAPTANASYIGQDCFDVTNERWYKAKALGSGASDWRILA